MTDTEQIEQVEATRANGDDGADADLPDRDERGRWLPGRWKGGPGNPQAGLVSKHRAAMFAAAKDDDSAKALNVLREIMENADNRPVDRMTAAGMLLDRLCGKPTPGDVDPERRETLVQMFLTKIVSSAPAAAGEADDQ